MDQSSSQMISANRNEDSSDTNRINFYKNGNETENSTNNNTAILLKAAGKDQ